MTSFRLVTIFAVFTAVLALVLLLSSPALVQGSHDWSTPTIEPAAPTEDDVVRISSEGVYYYASSQCGPYPESQSYSISGQTITIQLVWWEGGGGGSQCSADSGELPFGFWFDIHPLAARDYTVDIVEVYHYLYDDSYSSSDPFTVASFTVAPAPPDGDGDGDGVLNAGDNCPKWPNPAQNLPPWPVPANDPDCDAFSTAIENSAGTNPFVHCGVNAWPADVNNDGFVDVIGDISELTGAFGQSVPPAPSRYDIAPDPPDGFIDVIGDISRLAGLFGQSCT